MKKVKLLGRRLTSCPTQNKQSTLIRKIKPQVSQIEFYIVTIPYTKLKCFSINLCKTYLDRITDQSTWT
jgi:hypothetical protein